MVWQKIDDQFGVSQKVIRIPRKRRQQVVGLWVLAANYAVRALTDGVLEEHELDELDAKDTDVAELVRVGLWHRHGDKCDSDDDRCRPAPKGGVSIHDFLVYNPSRESVAAEREAKQQAGNEGNHQRWHVRRRITVEGCEFCESQTASHQRSQGDRSRESSANPPVPSRPVPSPLTDMTNDPESSHVGDVVASRTDFGEEIAAEARRAGIDDLPAVLGIIEPIVGPLNPRHGIELAQVILRRAKAPVLQPTAYIARACERRDEVRSIAIDILDLPGVIGA